MTKRVSAGLCGICERCTTLSPEDVDVLEGLSLRLPMFADLVQADIFIDVLDRSSSFAWVVAQASPGHGRSLYSVSVVGERALRDNEPAVMDCLERGTPHHGTRGISQEGVPVAQTVVPVRRDDRLIGALIMERNISLEVHRESQVLQLEATTANLAQTLLTLLSENDALSQVIADGLLLFDAQDRVVFANLPARDMLEGGIGELMGMDLKTVLEYCASGQGTGRRSIAARVVPLGRGDGSVASILTLRDVTDLRHMEQELLAKDTFIRELHHRVKNNLQTVASLLRLQARRSPNPDIRRTLQESVGRIFAMASVHETLLAMPGSVVSLREVVQRICANVGAGDSLSPHSQLRVTGDPLNLTQERCTSVALCINELVQNALEHAFVGRSAGSVTVRLADHGTSAVVEVIDDGVGMAAGGAGEQSFGLQIVRSLVEQDLHGELRIVPRPSVQVRISFPK